MQSQRSGDRAAGLIRAAIAALHAGRTADGARDLAAAEALRPTLPATWRAIGDGWRLAGEAARSHAAHLRAAQGRDPALSAARSATARGDSDAAAQALRRHLHDHPTDAAAIRLAAATLPHDAPPGTAERLLARALDLAPGFAAARLDLATRHHHAGRDDLAELEVNRLLAADPRSAEARALKGAIRARVGDLGAAITLYRDALADRPDEPRIRVALGNALKAVGDLDGAAGAYRHAATQAPGLGWWSLANLKLVRFDPDDVAAMKAAIAVPGLPREERVRLGFAIAKAHEDAGDDAAAFAQYDEANRLHRGGAPHDRDALARLSARTAAIVTPEFLAARSGWGDPASDPIFVVGLPRVGSTLVEQILASHPEVEGTAELPALPSIIRDLAGGDPDRPGSPYPACLGSLDREAAVALGRRYLDRAAPQRRSGRPRFVDKLPGNFAHVALIRLILPNAAIVDVRRGAMAAGVACFRQHFARGHEFAYDLADIGHHIRAYEAMMEWTDRALPGAVHRVRYEALVADLAGETARLLDHLALPPDPACLRYWEQDRAIRTPSAAQVRLPPDPAAIDRWRRFEPWLAPLADALRA